MAILKIKDEKGNVIPIPAIKGEDGLTPFINDNGNWQIGDIDTGVSASGESGETIIVDQTYNPTSENAQSGKAVAAAIGNINNQYELIEKIIVGYSILTGKPEDWESNFTAYYKNTGTLREPVYTALTELEEWESGKYYSVAATTPNTISKLVEPTGQPYNFKKVLISFNTKNAVDTSNTYGYIDIFYNNELKYNYLRNQVTGISTSQIEKPLFCEVLGKTISSYGWQTVSATKNSVEQIAGIKFEGFNKIDINSTIYIYGVRV